MLAAIAICASSQIEEQVSRNRTFGSSISATRRTFPFFTWMSRVIGSNKNERLFDHLELLESGLVDGQPETRSVVIEVDVSRLGFGFALEHVPEQFIPHFNVDDGKIFRHRRIQAGHDDVIIVHLAGMRNYRHGMGVCEGGNLASLRDSSHAICVELDVIESPCFQQFTESV